MRVFSFPQIFFFFLIYIFDFVYHHVKNVGIGTWFGLATEVEEKGDHLTGT